ncbi:uncharacterized protein BX663DRAFT_458728 [Cokeromyces recurvatus]|uniref:uncharacterized protein n=1 Tax=Cokeromyces recurvatus TaxID=90255 RepID=UPI002220D77D|nr:uncharacterized protein BX663DRAFT_458728 [Cokeromyces recurvatus]KAI7900507.1 hypothetical protein BX663DRAFT_458728 [Cokeromyces recurvatus]
MSKETILPNSTKNHYETMMININPRLIQKSNTNEELPSNTSYEQQQYAPYSAYAFSSMLVGLPSSIPDYQYRNMEHFNESSTIAIQRNPNSPEPSPSFSSSSTTPPPSTSNSITTVNNNNSNNVGFVSGTDSVITPQSINNNLITTPLISSSSPQNIDKAVATSTAMFESSISSPRLDGSTTARVKDIINRANAVPVEFYHTEFLEYSKETYEKKMESKRCNKRTRYSQQKQQVYHDNLQYKKKKMNTTSDGNYYEEGFDEEDKILNDQHIINYSSAEIRRQIHIQSEQKRRAQIKDGFDELRKHLPGCNNKKMSKAALLTRTVQQLQHLKEMQNELLSEVERLLKENESLKKFQHGILQRQAMEKIYTF